MATKDAARSRSRDRGIHLGKKPLKASEIAIQKKPSGYTSQGVTDNDVFILPSTDFQILGVLTFIGAIVRLFRIYQPSSVVFDEVQ